ncbi:MAG: hypothetical protein KDN18_00280 [Verrucomicrobiae bacterium]|nr:hypothetical protein [Verrucomicrobiae bacterium]
MSELEPEDSVWKLLDHASKVEPSPYFARRVVREARSLQRPSEGFFGYLLGNLRRHRALVATGAGAFAAIAFLFLSGQGGSGPEGAEGFMGSLTAEVYDVFDPASEMADLEYLGQLMAVTDPGQLDDRALSDLFF